MAAHRLRHDLERRQAFGSGLVGVAFELTAERM